MRHKFGKIIHPFLICSTPWFHNHRCLSPPFHTLRPPFLVKSQRLADHLVSGCRSYSFVPLRSDLHWQHLGVQGTIEAGCRDFRLDTSPLSWTGGVGRRGEGTPPHLPRGSGLDQPTAGYSRPPKNRQPFPSGVSCRKFLANLDYFSAQGAPEMGIWVKSG